MRNNICVCKPVIRWTTPTQKLNYCIDFSGTSKLVTTYNQYGEILLRKEKQDVKLDGETVVIRLTQEETGLFKAGREPVRIMINAVWPDGTRVARKNMYFFVEENDENGVIEP